MSLIAHLGPLLFIFNFLGITSFEKTGKHNFLNYAKCVPFLIVYFGLVLVICTHSETMLYAATENVVKSSDAILIGICAANAIVRAISNYKNVEKTKKLIIAVSKSVENYSSKYRAIFLVLFVALLNLITSVYDLSLLANLSDVSLLVVLYLTSNVLFLEQCFISAIVKAISLELTRTNEQLIKYATTSCPEKHNGRKYIKNSSRTIENVLEMTNKHYDLVNFGKTCNKIFRVKILDACGTNFALLVDCVHYMAHLVKIGTGGGHSDSFPMRFVAICGSWSLITLFYYYLAIRCWDELSNQVRTTFVKRE